jgi:hypothetical protein
MELAKVFPELVAVVEDVFTHICTSPFTLAYLKEFSRHGKDFIRNKEVDYGNFQYATVLKMLALVNNTICDALDAFSTAIPTLRVTHADTSASLIHQGDVIEALMGLYRHQKDGGFLGLANIISQEQIKVLFAKLVAVSRIVGNIYATCTGRRFNKRGDELPNSCFQELSKDTSLYMGSKTLHMARVFCQFVKSANRDAYSVSRRGDCA